MTTDTVYDGLGRVSQVSNPYRSSDTKYWTTTAYDGIGRVSSVTEQDNSATSTTYTGNTTTITDEVGHKRKSQTDGLGRLAGVWEDPSGVNYETDYSYNVLGDLIKAVQKGGSSSSSAWRTRTFAYDSLGELLCSANPEITSPLSSPATCPNPDNGSYTSGTVRYAYDKDGNVTSRIAPKENQQSTATVTTTFIYDTLNRLTGKSYNDGTASVSYAYDGSAISGCTLPTVSSGATNLISRMSGMCDSSGATAWSYDPVGRTLAEARRIGTVTDQVSYGYTLNGVVDSLTYPASGSTTAFTLTYNVNAADRVYSVVNGTTAYADVQSTWATGAPKVYDYGSNIQFSDSYNARLQPLTLTAQQISPANTLFNKTFNFNAGSSSVPGQDNGLLIGVTDGLDGLGLSRPNGSVNYTYDTLNRVISAKTLGTACTAVNGGTLNWGESITIDPWGNLIAKSPTLCTAESLNTSATALNQLAAATYDSAGNVTAYNGDSFTYDAEGRITSGAGTAYTYDGMGNRVSKPGKLYWRGTGSDPLAETSATDTTPTRYIFFGGKRIARIDPGATTPKYYVSDNLGSTALVTDYQGNILSESEYFPYGKEMQIATGDANDYKFTGKERDAESGNDYFGARYYTSSMGRFLSPDDGSDQNALNPASWNLYSYVQNNPLIGTDADGRSIQICTTLNGTQHCTDGIDDDAYKAAQQSGNSGGLSGPSLASLQNSASGSGNITDSSGNVVGTVQWTPDNPGIQGADAIQSFGQIGNDGMGAVKAFMTSQAIQVGLGVGGAAAEYGYGAWKAARLLSAANKARASEIAENVVNHAYNKHVVGRGEFGDITPNEFKSRVEDTILNPSDSRSLSNGRTAYWNDKEQMVVIENSTSPSQSTAFRPTGGKSYFDNLR
ncbi:RHS repeat-associated core domain-containing protein [Terracidiphilus gabretensis]|uniref:RHS repeat-associated core domain-containing protein n=1 Tax=Terracidiphilus gabretensis TaxID=1577687 RepID=UPI00071B0AA8|nr:RHS repeat-associated core domain-containing protein [Terracidiphilus gabretensis]